MAKAKQTHTTSELEIQKLLRTGGNMFPESVEEVVEYEKRHQMDGAILLSQELNVKSTVKRKSRKMEAMV
jgi:hypothetical protein